MTTHQGTPDTTTRVRCQLARARQYTMQGARTAAGSAVTRAIALGWRPRYAVDTTTGDAPETAAVPESAAVDWLKVASDLIDREHATARVKHEHQRIPVVRLLATGFTTEDGDPVLELRHAYRCTHPECSMHEMPFTRLRSTESHAMRDWLAAHPWDDAPISSADVGVTATAAAVDNDTDPWAA